MRRCKIFEKAVLAAMAGAMSACSTLSGYPAHPETADALTAKPIRYYGDPAETKYRAATDPEIRRIERNRLIYGRMRVIGDRFQDLERTLNGAGNTVSLGGDLAVILLNGIGAATGGAKTKSTLAIVSGGVVGAQGSINKDLYYQRTLPALIAQMQANFERQRLAIIQKLPLSDAEYPLEAAEGDLQKLEDAGSIPSAIGQITQQAQDDKAATDKLEQLRSLKGATTPTTTRLMAWLFKGDGSVDADNLAALQAWLNTQPESYLHDYPPAMFARGDTDDSQLEPIRLRAVSDPKLKIP